MMYYVERSIGGIQNRGALVEVEVPSPELDMYGVENTECYSSLFSFNETFKNHLDLHKSVRGYDGVARSHGLVWDIDSDSPQTSLEMVRELTTRLSQVGVDENLIRSWWSGSKGFHVYVPSKVIRELTTNTVNKVVKGACKTLSLGIMEFDESIYDRTRLFRVSNSMNMKTHLYKIPLRFDELREMGIEEIKEMSKKQRSLEWSEGETECSYFKGLLTETVNLEVERKVRKTGMASTTLLDGIKNGFADGEWNNGLASVAGMLHSRNIDPPFIEAVLSAIDNNGESPIGSSGIKTIVDSISKYPVNKDYVEPSSKKIVSMKSAMEDWVHLRKKGSSINTGNPLLDKQIRLFDPGQVMMIAGRSGSYKSTLGMQVANEMAKNLGGKALFASLEMTKETVAYRAAAITASSMGNDSSREDFFKQLVNDGEMRDNLISKWKDMDMISEDSLSLEDVGTYCRLGQSQTNDSYKVLLLDYFGLLRGTNDYHSISKIAREVKYLAKSLDIRIVMLVQLSRAGGDGTVEVQMNHLRDSGALEESADNILGLWVSASDTNRIHGKMLKNRYGERNVKFDFINHGLYLKNEEFQADSTQPLLSEGGTIW